MASVKFFTTFSKNGYFVYGKQWIESFLEYTKDYPNITAKVYIDGMSPEILSQISVENKLEVVDYYRVIPEQASWMEMFDRVSNHHPHVKELTKKFSFKSFCIFNALDTLEDDYVIWLDADCVFLDSKFDKFPNSLLKRRFMACQVEDGSSHVESGFVAFNNGHKDKQKFVDMFKSYYLDESNINTFGELFDGFAIYRAIANTGINIVNLNEGFGLNGVQSDPNCTFLNPELSSRFRHNIGITGKRQYDDWKEYASKDKYFKMIHGIDPAELKITKQDRLSRINDKVRRYVNKNQ